MGLFSAAIFHDLDDGKNDPTNTVSVSNFVGFLFFISTETVMSSLMP